MRFRWFRYPVDGDSDSDLEDLNAFLASHSAISVNRTWVQGTHGAILAFVVEYADETPGGSRAPVQEFAHGLDARLDRIAHEILGGAYAFGPYQAFRVNDGKSRVIHAPAFEQRVVHHAIALVTTPVLERGAVASSFACRKGLGHRPAIERAREHVRTTEWFLHVDVASYYDSISHELLKRALARRFRERRLLELFGRLIDSCQPRAGYGLPIGALTSQHLGNFYLDGIDHWALEVFRIRRYIRYMDDLAAWGDHCRLLEFREAVLSQLAALELSPRNGGILNRCSQGMTFLGFTLRPGTMRVHRRGRKRLRAKLASLHRSFRKGEVGEEEMQTRGTALFAWATQADDASWRRGVIRRYDNFGDALERRAGDARRQLCESGGELPVRLSQQEAAR